MTESLAGRAAGLEDTLFELRVAIKCLSKDINIKSAANKEMGFSGVKLPKISVPTFNGKTLKWRAFGNN